MKVSFVVLSVVVKWVACYGIRSEPSMTKPNLDWIEMADRGAVGFVHYGSFVGSCQYGSGGSNAFTDGYKYLSSHNSLSDCQQECQDTDGCTAISYGPSFQDLGNGNSRTHWCDRYRGGRYTKGATSWIGSEFHTCYDLQGPNYYEQQNKHCSPDHYGNYNSVEDAKAACSGDSNCGLVYDQGCDESHNNVYLCPMGASYYSSFSSCIYKKAAGCSCSSWVHDGFGKCLESYQDGPICYVNEPSTCTDLVSDESGKRYSWEACSERIWVDDGCASSVTSHEGSLQYQSYEAGVRCCSNDGGTCTTPLSCQDNQMSYVDAVSKCSEDGRRVCSKDELNSGICCGTGGNCDSYEIWTSTACRCQNGGTCTGVDANGDGIDDCDCTAVFGFEGAFCDNVIDCGYKRMEQQVEDEGNFLGVQSDKTQAECEEICDTTENCKSFGYTTDSQKCFLFDRELTGNEPQKEFYDFYTVYKNCVPCSTFSDCDEAFNNYLMKCINGMCRTT